MGGPTCRNYKNYTMQNYTDGADEGSANGAAPVNLSGGPNLTAGRTINIKRYRNGEITVVERVAGNPATPPPPRAKGDLTQKGLTSKAKGKIKKAARMMAHESKRQSFITLSYGREWPHDKEAKRHIDLFFKRLRRAFGPLPYIWVAERQQRGAIHFHILTTQYISRKELARHWNEIVQNWQSKSGYNVQEVQPNVIGVRDAGRYMAKYMAKGGDEFLGNLYGMSNAARELMHPVEQKVIEIPNTVFGNEIEEIGRELQDQGEDVYFIRTEEVNEETGEIEEGRVVGFFIRPGNITVETLSKVVERTINPLDST